MIDDGKIQCLLCEKYYSKIDSQHIKKHGLTVEEYIDKYPNAEIGYSKALLAKKSGHTRKHSDETKTKISNSLKNAWETHEVTDKQRIASSQNAKKMSGMNVGRTFAHSNETKEKIKRSKIKQLRDNPIGVFDADRQAIHREACEKGAITRQNNTIRKYISKINWGVCNNLYKDYYEIVCNTCSTKSIIQAQTIRKHNAQPTICHTCHPIFSGSSQLEDEVCDFIKSLNGDFKIQRHCKNILQNKEIDIIINNVAIEINGVYWHSDLYKDKNYHYDKTYECELLGYNTLNIYEDLWIHKKDILKSIITNKLSMSNKIFARKCDIRIVDEIEAKIFFNNNHLHGYSHASISLGLYSEDQLVSCMSFGKPRFNKSYEWEIIRFSHVINTNVIGGASKLFSFFIKNYNPNNILTYSECDIGNGNVYEKLGFKMISRLTPGYTYHKNGIRYNRMNFQKHKLKTFENYSQEKSEFQIMDEAKYLRIYDAGNKKWVWEKNG